MVAIVGKLRPVSPEKELQLLRGKEGLAGKGGKDGLPGKDGIGRDGKDGVHGKDGASPEHEVRNGEIRFRNSDGTWGEWIHFSTSSGGGLSEVVHQHIISESTEIVASKMLKGTNVLRVVTPDPITITLPGKIDKGALIMINDETGINSSIIVTTEF